MSLATSVEYDKEAVVRPNLSVRVRIHHEWLVHRCFDGFKTSRLLESLFNYDMSIWHSSNNTRRVCETPHSHAVKVNKCPCNPGARMCYYRVLLCYSKSFLIPRSSICNWMHLNGTRLLSDSSTGGAV